LSINPSITKASVERIVIPDWIAIVILKGYDKDCFGRIVFAFVDQVVCGRRAEPRSVLGVLFNGPLYYFGV
jgi:hypothetical protein